MTIHLPESHYTLTTLIIPEDMPDQALLKAPPRLRRRLWKRLSAGPAGFRA